MSSNEAGSSAQVAWRTASLCTSGECVQVAQRDGLIILRDSTRPDGTTIRVADEGWRSFVRSIKAGSLDDRF